MSATERIRPLRFVVVDAAPALGHVTDELGLKHADILVAGCHKWLQSRLPMGVGFLPRLASAEQTIRTAERMLRHVELDDPLLALTRDLATGHLQTYSETVNLASLFTCRAAITDRGRSPAQIDESLRERLQNANRVKRIAAQAGWSNLHETMPTGIVMLQTDRSNVRRVPTEELRRYFVAHSASVTAYEDGIIRLGMPDRPLSQGELDLFAWSLERCRFEDQRITHAPATTEPALASTF